MTFLKGYETHQVPGGHRQQQQLPPHQQFFQNQFGPGSGPGPGPGPGPSHSGPHGPSQSFNQGGFGPGGPQMGPGPGGPGPGGPMGPGPGPTMMNMMPGKWLISKFIPKI